MTRGYEQEGIGGYWRGETDGSVDGDVEVVRGGRGQCVLRCPGGEGG